MKRVRTIRAEFVEKQREEKDSRGTSPGFLEDFTTRLDVSSGGKSKNSGETRNEDETTKKKK